MKNLLIIVLVLCIAMLLTVCSGTKVYSCKDNTASMPTSVKDACIYYVNHMQGE